MEQKAVQEGELKRGLKRRHINMIAIGGVIGTGLFLASGFTISKAGPGGGPLAYLLIGIMVFFLMMSLGEMATFMPVSGSFQTYSDKFVHPAFGFAIGWNYWLNWSVTIGCELVAGSVIMKGFFPDVNPFVWCAILGIIIFVLNILSVKSYGEAEFWFASLKVLTIIAFIITGLLLVVGVVGEGPAIGLSNFSADKGGPFPNGIWAVIMVSFSAVFSYLGAEIIGIAAGETENPEQNIPRAARAVFWRVLLFYVGSMLVVGLVIPYQEAGVAHNPFARVFELAGFPAAAVFMNIVILTSLSSCANSGLYVSSRMLTTLAQEGKAPRIFARINKRGVPVPSVIATMLVGLCSFLTNFFSPDVVYVWLVSIIGLATLFSWFGIALAHFKFRKWYLANGYKLEDLKFRAPWYPFGPVLTMIFCAVILCGQFASPDGKLSVYFGVPVFIALLLYGFYHTRDRKTGVTVSK